MVWIRCFSSFFSTLQRPSELTLLFGKDDQAEADEMKAEKRKHEHIQLIVLHIFDNGIKLNKKTTTGPNKWIGQY